MNFRRLHALAFAPLPLIGVGALQTIDTLPAPLTRLSLIGLVAALATPESVRRRIPNLVANGIPVALSLGAAFALHRGTEPVLVAVEFSVALQLLRALTRTGAAHDPQIVILSILHLVAAAVLGGTLGFGLSLGAFAVAAPAALTLSHLRREVERNYAAGAKDRSGSRVDVERILRSQRVVEVAWIPRSLVLAPFVAAFTVALFLVVPRVGLAAFLLKPALGARMIGFSDSINLGDFQGLRANEALAARVDWTPRLGGTAPPILPFYLRGTAFDSYDGVAWKRTETTVGVPISLSSAASIALGPRPRQPTRAVIHLEPLEPTMLFVPNGTRTLLLEAAGDDAGEVVVLRGPEGEWRYGARQPLPMRYETVMESDGTPSPSSLSDDDQRRYTSLPEALDARIPALATAAAGDTSTVVDRAQRIARHLRENYSYSITPQPPGKGDPLATFLFASRSGHCEFFSTALALMLRTQGIPARNVTGFAGAELNTFGGYYSVRQQNAHSWVEYWHSVGDNVGRWEVIDATPAATAAPIRGPRRRLQELYEALSANWDRHVASFDIADQASLASRLLGPIDRFTQTVKRAFLENRALATGFLAASVLLIAIRRFRRVASPGAALGSATPDVRAPRTLVLAVEHALAAFGTRGLTETPRGYVARVAPASLAGCFADVLDAHELCAYGGEQRSSQELQSLKKEMRRALAQVRQAPPSAG